MIKKPLELCKSLEEIIIIKNINYVKIMMRYVKENII